VDSETHQKIGGKQSTMYNHKILSFFKFNGLNFVRCCCILYAYIGEMF